MKDKIIYSSIAFFVFVGGVFGFLSNQVPEPQFGAFLDPFITPQGGTGTTTEPLTDQILIGGDTNNQYDVKTLVAGSNITITTSSAQISIAATQANAFTSIAFDEVFDSNGNYLEGTSTKSISSFVSSTMSLLTSDLTTTTNATTTRINIITSLRLAGSEILDFIGDATISLVSGFLRVVDLVCTNCINATEIEDIYLFDDGDVGTGVFDFGGADSFEMVNGASPTVNAIGEFAFDTTDNQVVVATSTTGTGAVIRTEERIHGFNMASTSGMFFNGGVLPVPLEVDGYQVTKIRCYVKSGTSVVVTLSDGTNDMDALTCATTATSDDGSIANAVVTAEELMEIQIGTISGVVDYLNFSIFGTWTRE